MEFVTIDIFWRRMRSVCVCVGGGGGGGGGDDHSCMTSSMYLFQDCGVGMMNISLVPRPTSHIGVTGFHTEGGRPGISPPQRKSPRILKVYVQFYMALWYVLGDFSWSFD